MAEQGTVFAGCRVRRDDRPIKPQNLLLRLNHSKQLHQQQQESGKQMENDAYAHTYVHKCCQLGRHLHTYT